MKITVFGTGYVGLVQGATLAESGHEVLCVDIDANKIGNLENGLIPIFEPGLSEVVLKAQANGTLKFTTDPELAVAHGSIQFIAVGTPPDEDGSADLRYVLNAAKTIANKMADYKCIVNKSTVPVGTAAKVHAEVDAILKSKSVDYQFDVVSNPEFLKEGAALNDCRRPDRIILGTDSKRAENLLRIAYAPFNRNHDKIMVMSARSAELTKYAANCMLATKISFINEISNLAERLGADIEEVRKGIGSDPRIGYHFIYPGIGYGGSCFPKDVQALIRTAEDIGFHPLILQAVEKRNAIQKTVLLEKILNYFDGNIRGKTISIWGLAFKPNTDDMREAPSRVLIESLWNEGAIVKAYDPEAMPETLRIYGARADLILCPQKEDALHQGDALVIATEWQEFRAASLSDIRNKLNRPVIFDGRNIYDPSEAKIAGISLVSIGRTPSGEPSDH